MSRVLSPTPFKLTLQTPAITGLLRATSRTSPRRGTPQRLFSNTLLLQRTRTRTGTLSLLPSLHTRFSTTANMATASAPASSLLSLLYRSYPKVIPSQATELNLQTITPKLYPTNLYSDTENVEIEQWLATIQKLTDALAQNDDPASISTMLGSLNTHLATRTTILCAKPSVADVAVYASLGPVVEKWSSEERTGVDGYHHIVRHVDFVQNAPLFHLDIPGEEKIKIDVNEVKAAPKTVTVAGKDGNDKKKAKKEKKGENEATVVVGQVKDKIQGAVEGVAAAVTGGGKKEKKEKGQGRRPKPAPPAPAPLSPSLVDLRVGHILRAINHPNADSLYVSTISCGDAPGAEHTQQDETTGLTVRTVCSGLNGLIPLEEMQGRKIVTVCNLKPVTMRGIKSAAMVLAASPRNDDSHAGPVELVNPPEGAEAGERVFFEGWGDGQPEKVLNPKKKVWETVQPGFTTTGGLEVVFDSSAVPQLKKEGEDAPTAVGKLVTQSGGVCTVQTLQDAVVR